MAFCPLVSSYLCLFYVENVIHENWRVQQKIFDFSSKNNHKYCHERTMKFTIAFAAFAAFAAMHAPDASAQNSTAFGECAAYPVCAVLYLTGECCPTIDDIFLDCCFGIEDKQSSVPAISPAPSPEAVDSAAPSNLPVVSTPAPSVPINLPVSTTAPSAQELSAVEDETSAPSSADSSMLSADTSSPSTSMTPSIELASETEIPESETENPEESETEIPGASETGMPTDMPTSMPITDVPIPEAAISSAFSLKASVMVFVPTVAFFFI
jgi:hypothetical protein